MRTLKWIVFLVFVIQTTVKTITNIMSSEDVGDALATLLVFAQRAFIAYWLFTTL